MESRSSSNESFITNSRKSTLVEALRNILSPSETARRKAEELLKALEVTEKFGVYLVDLIVDEDEKIEIRLLSLVLLKQHIEVHWCKNADKFQKPEITATTKNYIKTTLPKIFVDPATNLRSNAAFVMATIAIFEYPTVWPAFVSSMSEIVKSHNPIKSHGAMQTLFFFVTCVDSVEWGKFSEIMMLALEIAANSNQRYSSKMRSRAIKIFRILVMKFNQIEINDEKKNSDFSETTVMFLDAFVNILSCTNRLESENELIINVMKTIHDLVENFPHVVEPYLPRILPIIWQLLVKASDEYKNQSYLNEDEMDEEGDTISVDSQIVAIFEFVRMLCNQKDSISNNLRNVITDLVFHAIVCMQITPAIMNDWTKNHENFVAVENDDHTGYKVRQSAYNLFLDLMERTPPVVAIPAFSAALCRHICLSEEKREANMSDWWQGLEASMYALGSIHPQIIAEYNRNSLSDFNLLGYLNMAGQYTRENDIPLLLGRCIWLCGMYCRIMNCETLEIVISSAMKHLQFSPNIFVRIYALRSIKNYCLLTVQPEKKSLLEKHLPEILNSLCNMTSEFGLVVLRLILEVFTLFVKVNESFTVASIEKIVSFIVVIFLKCNDNPVTVSLMIQLIKSLVRVPNVLNQFQQLFAPTILGVLNTPANLATTSVHITALEILGLIVKYQREPLDESFLNSIFPTTINVILNTNDCHVLQAGGECLSNFLFSGAAQQICMYRNAEGHLGIDYIIEVINKLLDPHGYEYSTKFIQLLIIILIVKAREHVFLRLEPLLRAILSKMQCTESDQNMQNLISIFAYLIHTQIDAVINFLNTIPGPNGEAALEFVLTEWVYTHSTIQNEFEYKIGVVAFIQLFEYGITKDNFVLRTMAVTNTGLVDNGHEDTTWIPIMGKILKVLLNSIDTSKLEGSTGFSNENLPLHSFETEEVHEEEETMMSLLPLLAHLNTNDHICSFFHTYKTNEVFLTLYQHFDDKERDLLRRIGIDLSSFMIR